MSRILNGKQKKKLSDPNVSGCVQNKRTYTTSTTLLIRSGISNSNGAQMSESRQTEACSLAHRIFCESKALSDIKEYIYGHKGVLGTLLALLAKLLSHC